VLIKEFPNPITANHMGKKEYNSCFFAYQSNYWKKKVQQIGSILPPCGSRISLVGGIFGRFSNVSRLLWFSERD
jgi:hypothetical protein